MALADTGGRVAFGGRCAAPRRRISDQLPIRVGEIHVSCGLLPSSTPGCVQRFNQVVCYVWVSNLFILV